MTKKSLLSPKSDYIFKLIFGDQRNTDILAAFLQAILDLPPGDYERLTIVDPHLKPEAADDKAGVLDVKIHTAGGKVVEVEIQIQETPQMRERIVYYVSKMVTEQVGKGDEYNTIKKVISIIITDYALVKENSCYHNKYRLYDKKTGSEFTDVIEVNTLELPKLPIKYDETALFYWLSFLKSEREEELQVLAEKSPQLKKAVGVLMELSEDERTRMIEEAREKARRDESARMAWAKRTGIEQGIEQGIERIAKNLLQEEMPVARVAKLTGLSEGKISELQKTPKN